MSRPRRCALALIPLLVAGAAACGGGDGDRVSDARRAVADAKVRAFVADHIDFSHAPACQDWLDASSAVRSAAAVDLSRVESEPPAITVTPAELMRGLDRWCNATPVPSSMVSAWTMVLHPIEPTDVGWRAASG
jgi:hypothetical protein